MTGQSNILTTLKASAGRVLKRSPRAYAAASRLLYRLDRSFRSLSPGTPEAIDSAWQAAHQLQKNRPGDYYEFGLFRGYTLWHAEQSARRLGIQPAHFWGFDSFCGLPQVAGTDAEDGLFFEGQFACSLEDVVQNLAKHDADLDRISLIEGFFSESLTPELKLEQDFHPVGVALIDCDLYTSTKTVLDWLEDLLQEGSIILFDDWKSFGERDDRGQPRAFREFLDLGHWRARPFTDFGQHGRGMVMERITRN